MAPGVLLTCPSCGSDITTSEGVTLHPKDILDAGATDGLDAIAMDFLKRYDGLVCLYNCHCSRCGISWKSMDAYPDQEDAARLVSSIQQLVEEKGITE